MVLWVALAAGTIGATAFQRAAPPADMTARAMAAAETFLATLDSAQRAKTNLAALYRDQSRYDLAEPLYEGVVQAQTVKLGADHPDTLVSKNGLAAVYRGEGRFDEAESLFKEVVAARTANLGGDHPDTLTTMNNLALLYQTQKRCDLAVPLFRDVVEGSRRKLGPDHPDTERRMHSLAQCAGS
jgi:tetratricopeptide (TPR) repeat protein